MRFLVIGRDAIALRRARLLSALGHTTDQADLAEVRARPWWRVQARDGLITRLRFAWSGTADPQQYDGVFLCTPLYTRVQLALECLRVGLRGIFIEAPFASDLDGVEELRRSIRDQVVMIGCPLRFAFHLPHYSWSLLELMSSRPRAIRRSGAALAAGRGLSAEVAYPELDLAYAVNGPMYRLNCLSSEHLVRITIEHESSAHTEIQVDARATFGRKRLAVITAYDDGSNICVPHTPLSIKLVPTDQMYVDEMVHFCHCLRTREAPCNTISDATYVLSLTLQAGASGRKTAALED